jgi:aspartate aminotransferase
MVNIQSQSTSNPTSIAQVAAEAALDGDQSFIAEMVRAFKARHDYVVGALNGIRGVRCLPAQGAFYLFPDTREAMQQAGAADDVAFADLLLRETGVALVPGSAFGAPGFQRVSIATSMENLEKAMERLARFLGTA